MKDKNYYWNLGTIYPSIESDEYRADKDELLRISHEILHQLSLCTQQNEDSAQILAKLVSSFARLADLEENLGSYVYAQWSVDTGNKPIQRELSHLENLLLKPKDALVRFRTALKDCAALRESIAAQCSSTQWLDEQFKWASHQMSPQEESLAADLQRSGADAWERLHGQLSSIISSKWDDEQKTLTELRSMAYHPSREIRRSAWEKETALLKSQETAFAAALNGVKGSSESLNRRRHWGSTLEKSLFQNRLSHQTLDVLLGSMTKSLPMFRRYLRAKARHLGLEKLAWYDIFAPLGENHKVWAWDEVQRFITDKFSSFSKPMGEFAHRAFSERWIDVLPREGKIGGAYCTGFPLAGQSRILCNFDGSFDAVSTVAHELGHAWHGELMKDVNSLNRDYPMILAETASIFAETLVFHTALEQADQSESLLLLDTYLMGANQVITDILSRFLFESALMRQRGKEELSAEELCRMMIDAQIKTYGDSLIEEARHPWMWAVKGHYYSADLAFYNFPYAFGQLFALALFARSNREGESFPESYAEILRRSGSEDALTLASLSGFDINAEEFWMSGISTIIGFIDRFEAL